MGKMKNVLINRFDKGLISNVTNEALDDNALPLMKNMDFDNRLGLIRRLGYRDNMPSLDTYPQFSGVQQGYLKFNGRPYGIEDYDLLFDFDKHIRPKETETSQETKFLAVDGKLYLVENNISGSGEIKEETKFVPENLNWVRSVNIETWDEVSIENTASGSLKFKVSSTGTV